MQGPLEPKTEVPTQGADAASSPQTGAAPAAPSPVTAPQQSEAVAGKPKPGFVPVGFSADEALPADASTSALVTSAPEPALSQSENDAGKSLSANIIQAPVKKEPVPTSSPAVSATELPVPASATATMQPQTPRPPKAGEIDIAKILLPKKGVPSIDTAMRANAAEALKASVPETRVAPASTVESLTTLASAVRQEAGAAPRTQAETEAPAQASAVPAVRTYKRDVEETVRGSNVSMVSVAAAESQRRERAPLALEQSGSSALKWAMLAGGAVLLLAGAAALAFVFLRPAPSTGITKPTAPMVFVDDTKTVEVSADTTHASLINSLERERESTRLALGLLARLYLSSASASGASAELTAPQFLALLAPSAPPAWLRAFSGPYVLGVHSFDGNQPLLILKTDSYEQAYAGMLQWEPLMQDDLGSLFVRAARQHIPEEGNLTPPITDQVIQTPFTDRVVENHDTRVIQNSTGDILLLWTFLDRRTLVITTNEFTLREAISRLKEAPVVPQPGQ